MDYINRVDINFKDDSILHPYYRTFRSAYVHSTGLPVFDTYERRAPLVTKVEAKEKCLEYDAAKIYGFVRTNYGFVSLYLPFECKEGTGKNDTANFVK